MDRVLQSSTRIIGLGYGTFAILLGVLLAILIFLISRFTRHSEAITLAGLVIPVVLILVFVLPPRQSQRPAIQPNNVTDPRFIPYVLFMVLAVVGFILGLFFEMQAFVFNYKFGKNVAQLGLNQVRQDTVAAQGERRSEAEEEERKLLP